MSADLTRWLAGLAILVLLTLSGSTVDAAPDDAKRQPFVNKIIINGNRFFSADDLKKQMTTKESSFFSVFKRPRLREDFLRRDIGTLEAFYHANGFLEATVKLKEIRKLENEVFVDIIIEVEEKEATRVDVVHLENVAPLEVDDIKKDLLLKPGVPFNPSILAGDVYAIKLKFYEYGYLATVVDDSVTVTGRKVRIDYRVSRGPAIRIRKIDIVGNKLTNRSVIEKELTIKEGERFRMSKVLETQRNLFETGLFNVAEILREEPNLTHKFVDIVVRVRERKSASIEAGFGVGNVLGSRVFAEWGDRNLFGTGRLLRVRAEYSFGVFRDEDFDFSNLDFRVKFFRYDAQFGQRRLFGTKVLLGINAFLEKDATVDEIIIRTRGASIAGRRSLSRHTDIILSLSQERIRRQSPDDNENSTSNSISGTMSNDTRDFILDPRQGGFRDVNLTIAGGILGGDNDFYTATTSIQRYLRLSKGTILALRARTGFADAFGGSEQSGVPIENRFFTGGGNSVRGFAENSLGPRTVTDSTLVTESVLGGDFLLLTNAELRFPLPLLGRFRFSGAAFLDAGNVWDAIGDVALKHFAPVRNRADVIDEDYRYSAGFGVRYNTPVGPIRLDYGLPLKRANGVDSARFHISLGQMF